MIGALAGIAVGVLTIVLARAVRGQRWMYSIGLITLPSLYASFGMRAGERSVAWTEMIYGIPYIFAGILFAIIGMRRSATVVGALWIFHGLYDLIHARLITNSGVPGWYPVFCFSVDLVVGAYVLWLARRIPNADLRMA